jgi:hypothetical protein
VEGLYEHSNEPLGSIKDREFLVMGSEFLMAMKMFLVVFRVVMQCGLVAGYQCFGGTGLKMEVVCSSETFVLTYESSKSRRSP